MTLKLWANSGDSHLTEPFDIWNGLPDDLRELMPRSERNADNTVETIHVDGQVFTRQLPTGKSPSRAGTNARPEGSDERELVARFLGSNDADHRLKDLDSEGIWAEVIYPSLGIWSFNIRTPRVAAAASHVLNEWALDYQRSSPRFVCCASIPLVDPNDAAAEVRRAAAAGFMASFLPVRPPLHRPDWHDESWNPLWEAHADTGMVIGFHIGTEPHDPTERTGVYYRGQGGAVLNYVETTYGGQRAVTKLIASGALDRHPQIRVLVSEGGATWGPFLADRMDEAYRQHGMGVRPKLSRMPSEYLYEQVYASFQHDSSAVKACTALGWQNVMWGSDYPHFEGTFGHTQETLHGLFDGVDTAASLRIRSGAFRDLFPSTPPAARRPGTSQLRAHAGRWATGSRPSIPLAVSSPAPESMSTTGRMRSSQRGSHQLAAPMRRMVAGTRIIRTTVASRKMAVASPRPSILTTGSVPSTNPTKTDTMMSAAEVITRAVDARPCTTARSLSPVA